MTPTERIKRIVARLRRARARGAAISHGMLRASAERHARNLARAKAWRR